MITYVDLSNYIKYHIRGIAPIDFNAMEGDYYA